MVSDDGRGDGRGITVQDLIAVRKPSEVRISPDGRWVAFVVMTPDLGDNSYTHDLYVVAADGSAPPRRITHKEARSEVFASVRHFFPVWAPTSDRLIYVERRDGEATLRSVDMGTGADSVILTAATLGEGYHLVPGWPIHRRSPLGVSPDGRLLAFLAMGPRTGAAQEKLLRAIEAGEDFDPNVGEASPGLQLSPGRQLYVMDLQEARVWPLTDEELDVASFDWSPDGRRLAFEAATDPGIGGHHHMTGDIYTVDVTGGPPLRIVELAGWDRLPAWSPDGSLIAFGTQRGITDWMYTASLAVVAADGSSPPRYLGDELDRLGGGTLYTIHWSPDGAYVDVSTVHRLSVHLFRVSAADGAAERVTPREDRYYDDFSYSLDGMTVALTVQGAVVPPDVYVSSTESFAPRRLTDLNPEWDALRVPAVQMTRWRSRDGRWDVHGLVLMPPDYDPGQRYPMLTAIVGGPSMVRQQFNPVWNYPLPVLADQGYVVFLPNSRGRGGFGMNFLHAIRDEESYVLNPLSDVLDGVDMMVAEGIADPDRLGLLGFSYGGTLTSYAVTVTDRFQAAIYGEGAPSLMDVMIRYPNAFHLGLHRDMFGLGNPFEPAVIQRAIEQSSIFRLHRVRTPVLIEVGEMSFGPGIAQADRALYRGLRHFGVPAEFYVYPRSDHGWDEPLLMQDAYRRHLAWFDYWIRDEPYPDPDKQREYDDWKTVRGATAGQP